MLTLTFETQPTDPRSAFDNFRRAFKRRWKTHGQWAWIMEYQERGVVHYHIFLGSDFLDLNGVSRSDGVTCVTRRRKRTSLLGGVLGDWCRDQWMHSVGSTSQGFAAFQAGGILEFFRKPDAAARYVAKEAGKRFQKRLPEGINGGNRWFWSSPACKPIPLATATLAQWPFAICVGKVFDHTWLDGHLHSVNMIEPGTR